MFDVRITTVHTVCALHPPIPRYSSGSPLYCEGAKNKKIEGGTKDGDRKSFREAHSRLPALERFGECLEEVGALN